MKRISCTVIQLQLFLDLAGHQLSKHCQKILHYELIMQFWATESMSTGRFMIANLP